MIDYLLTYNSSELIKFNVVIKSNNYLRAMLSSKIGIIEDFSTSGDHAKFTCNGKSKSIHIKRLKIL